MLTNIILYPSIENGSFRNGILGYIDNCFRIVDFWIKTFWMVWNGNMCLDKIFGIDKFKIKIMSLCEKKNLKWCFTITEWRFTIEKPLELLIWNG